MTRILLLSPADLDLPDDVFAADLLDADTEIVHRRVIYPSCPPIGAHDWALADLAVLAAGQDAQSEGFQAVCLADFGDYGANALRSVLDIPVVTAGRTSMLYALTLGAHFSVLTTQRDLTRTRKMVHEYALDAQCSGVHLAGADAELTANADVHIMTWNAGRIPDLHQPATRIDPLPVALKMSESLVGLNLAHSRMAYPSPQIRKAELISAMSRTF